jgi:hypothetical protein
LEAERAAKLQDARSRYAVRVEVELVNILLLAQPKVILPVTITNRTATITRSVVWDPLVHRLEPLVCDVCGQPGEGLHLCTGGHLAHAGCLAPQCVDCKRSFCGLCAAQVAACVVCQRPVCRPSLITCPTCGRGTCREHQQLCHAAQGQPVSLSEPAAQAPASKPPPAAPVQTPQPPEKPRRPPPASAGPRPTRAQPPEKPVSPASTAPVAQGVRIDVQIYETEPVIAAFVMRSTHRILATRSFELTPQGILVRCDCEKSPCPADSYYHRPGGPGAIKAQVEALLQRLLEEYLIPEKRMHYVSVHGQRVVEIRRLELPAAWRDP